MDIILNYYELSFSDAEKGSFFGIKYIVFDRKEEGKDK